MMFPLPGQSVTVSDDEWGTKCYTHPDVDATHRVCVEADSFGEEYVNFCKECWDERLKALEEAKNDPEQWEHCPECKTSVPKLISYRDYEEGMHGPVYKHCESCHSKMNARIERELEMDDDDDDSWVYDDSGWDDMDDDQSEDPPYLYENAPPISMIKLKNVLTEHLGIEFDYNDKYVFAEIDYKQIKHLTRDFKKLLYKLKVINVGGSTINVDACGITKKGRVILPNLEPFKYTSPYEFTHIGLVVDALIPKRGLCHEIRGRNAIKKMKHVFKVFMGSGNQPA